MREHPCRLGPPQRGVGHAAVHGWRRRGDHLEGGAGAVGLTHGWTSRDGGLTLSAPRELATASRSADHPKLVVTRQGLRVSWFSADTGCRLLPVEEATRSH
jgi:hypothetical protein